MFSLLVLLEERSSLIFGSCFQSRRGTPHIFNETRFINVTKVMMMIKKNISMKFLLSFIKSL